MEKCPSPPQLLGPRGPRARGWVGGRGESGSPHCDHANYRHQPQINKAPKCERAHCTALLPVRLLHSVTIVIATIVIIIIITIMTIIVDEQHRRVESLSRLAAGQNPRSKNDWQETDKTRGPICICTSWCQVNRRPRVMARGDGTKSASLLVPVFEPATLQCTCPMFFGQF